MFPVYGFRLTIFRPFGEQFSYRGVDNLRSPVITWPAGLCMNGKLAQVQSGGLDIECYAILFPR